MYAPVIVLFSIWTFELAADADARPFHAAVAVDRETLEDVLAAGALDVDAGRLELVPAVAAWVMTAPESARNWIGADAVPPALPKKFIPELYVPAPT